MRDSSIAPISWAVLLATLIAVAPATASAHGHGGHHGGSGGRPGGFAFVPIFTPRIGAPGAFGPAVPGFLGPSPFLHPSPVFGPSPILGPNPVFGPSPRPGPLGGPVVLPGWSGPPSLGIVLGSPTAGIASPEATRAEAARESDLDQQIGALPPPPPDAGADHSQPPDTGEDDSGWSPL